MSLSKLPLECLQLVLQLLQDQKARGTLASLLRVNRFICAAALPYLYSQALDVPPYPQGFNKPGEPTLINSILKGVIQLLLRQRPVAEISELLDLAYDVFPERRQSTYNDDSSTSSRKPSIDYLSFIHNFDFESSIYSPQYRFSDLVFAPNDYPSFLAAYAFKTKTGDLAEEFGEGAHDQDLLLPLEVMTEGRDVPKKSFFRYGALSGSLRRDLTWTLSSPVLEQIQSLIIPLSDIGRYLDSIERFESLKSVTFMMDELLTLPKRSTFDAPTALTETDSQQLDTCHHRRDRQFESMIEFVRLHSLLFKNKLQTANCPSDRRPWSSRRIMECPIEVLEEMRDHLAVLAKPRSVDHENWQQIARKIHVTDLSCVGYFNVLRYDGIKGRAERTLFDKDPLFLQRCRALKSLCLSYPPGMGSFSWARKERMDWDAYRLASSDPVTTTTSTSITTKEEYNRGVRNNDDERTTQHAPSSQSSAPPSPLIALEFLSFSTEHQPFGDQLDDLVFAFGETLKHINLDSFAFSDNATSNHLFFRLEGNWWLPRIEILTFTTWSTPIVIDPEFYTQALGADHLTRLNLEDKCEVYRFQELIPCRPFQQIMPKLTSLELGGRPALTFHPDSFHKTPNLQSMNFSLFGHEAETFIPPVNELMASFQGPDDFLDVASEDDVNNATTVTSTATLALTPPLCARRPLWTWDWHLPKLVQLNLKSEFAFLFKFRMLAGCPSLESLILNFCTHEHQHQRRLSVQEFIYPDDTVTAHFTSSSSEHCDHPNVKFIQAPLVKRLLFYGHWIMDDEVIKLLYGTVFTGVQHLTEYQTSGYTTKSWLSAMRAMPGGPPRRADCGLEGEGHVGSEVLSNLGLVYKEEQGSTLPKECRYRFRGHNYGLWAFAEDLKVEETS